MKSAQKKTRQLPFLCESCDSRFPKWLGKCPQCGAWNSIVEKPQEPQASFDLEDSRLFHLSQLNDLGPMARKKTEIEFLDRILGGGLPAGAAVLVAGQPGSGKSSLMFQVAKKIAQSQRVLYVSAEESPQQLGYRFSEKDKKNDFYVLSEHRLEAIEAAVRKMKPKMLVVDSIQMISSVDSSLKAGGASLVRETAESLIALCKSMDCGLWIVGHVTKEGEIAGPRSLEHLVDSVLLFSLAEDPGLRLLQVQKHRFGASGELAVLEMKKSELFEVPSAQSFWLGEHSDKTIGCAYSSCLMGSRVYCVEIQALCVSSQFPSPRRSSTGVELNRLFLILAVLEKHLKIPFSQLDVYLNVVGGLKLNDPNVDFAVSAALVSAFSEKALDPDSVYLGELGLTGEIRTPNLFEQRLRSLSAVGKKRFLSSKKSLQLKLSESFEQKGFSHIGEAFQGLL